MANENDKDGKEKINKLAIDKEDVALSDEDADKVAGGISDGCGTRSPQIPEFTKSGLGVCVTGASAC